jgi:hypothetical protein
MSTPVHFDVQFSLDVYYYFIKGKGGKQKKVRVNLPVEKEKHKWGNSVLTMQVNNGHLIYVDESRLTKE